MGIPFELISLLGSAVLGGVLQIWQQSIAAKKEARLMEIKLLNAKAQPIEQARQYRSKSAEKVRGIIAIMTVFSVVLLPKLAAIFFPTLNVMVGYMEWHPEWIFGIREGYEAIGWKTILGGLVITPLDTILLSSLAGFYFGAVTARSR